jgi:xanthine dehydrogenase large subunit
VRDFVRLHINGRPVEARGSDAFATLTDLLRKRERLVGTKVVCAEGDCGACTVLVGRRVDGALRYAPVCACIQLVGNMDGTHVVTVEGLSDCGLRIADRGLPSHANPQSQIQNPQSVKLSPLQRSLVSSHGTQCGFCTPGFVVSMHHHLTTCGSTCTDESLRRAISGNLCRCTGYDSIVRAGLQTDRSSLAPVDAIYPSESIDVDERETFITAPGATLFKPTTVDSLVAYLTKHPDATIVAGETDYGVLVNKHALKPTKLVSLFGVPELMRAECDGKTITLGGAATVTQLEWLAHEHLPELAEYLQWFGSSLIRNAGTVAGNLATASPIGDLTPPLIVLDAELHVASASGRRVIAMRDFILGYRKTALRPGEAIVGIRIPLPPSSDVVRFYKVAKRKDLDISTVNASFRLSIDAGNVIREAKIVMGGVGATVLRMTRTERALVRQIATANVFEQAGQVAHDEVTPIDDVRGSATYRRAVARGLVEKFGAEWARIREGEAPAEPMRMRDPMAPVVAHPQARQEPRPPVAPPSDPYVGRDVPHESAATHVTGQSVFLDDVAPLAGELVVGIVPAPVAAGRLKSLDFSAARCVPGVATIITAADIADHNRFGPVVHDEDLLVADEIAFMGQPLAIIAATSAEALDEARQLVRADIESQTPIVSIDEAIAAGSYLGQPRHMARGDLDAGFASAEKTITGTLDIGGQEHFYLESQIAIAVPGEQGTMTVHSSTQHPSEVQMMVAEVLGVPFSKVVCVCKRMGGGFGGKETQAAQPAMFAALVAARTGRPARFAYSKDDDMRFTGKRHPFKAVYRAGFKRDGSLVALDLQLYSNGGCSTDLSFAVLERAMLHSDNAYYLPAVRIVGRVCKTNLPSNTAFRGFGGPQGVATIEHVLQRIAHDLSLDPLDVRTRNLYGEAPRNVTQYGQTLANNTLPELFASIRREGEYEARRDAITRFNATSRTHVKGIAVSPVKFGISFTRRTLNQANALVNVYQDGSAIVSTGATEMGQGVHTRIRQIVADELGISMDRVVNTATSTDKNNNTSPTAASSGTDLNGAAAVDACSRIRERLSHVAAELLKSDNASHIRFAHDRVWDERDPARSIAFKDVCCAAYEQRVSLGERGFYATPGVDFDRSTGKGTPFLYFTNGVACSEVTVDRFTGEFAVDRVDLIMDVGESINPGIDRGQIVGGFVQGMGWCTAEELKYDAKGKLLSYSPTTYKVPASTDVPADFRVRFLDNPNNTVSLRRSKAVGEPPLMLGLSVWLAASDALANAGHAPLDALPATAERVKLAMAM